MPAATAQDSDPEVEASVEFAFGRELRFLLEATDAASVEQLRLEFRPEFATELYAVDVPFEPGETISVTYPVDVSLIHLQPFSELKYSWQLEMSEGSLDLPEQSIIYEDDQFQWLQSAREAAAVHWTGNGPSFGSDALNVVDDALSELVSVLPLESVNKFDIYVYPSSAELREGLEAVGLAGEKTTHPELGVIFVTAVNPQSAVSDLGQSIPYELAHLLIYQLAGTEYANFPWWLAEGLGTMFQGKPDTSLQNELDRAVQAGSTLPLWQLCQSPQETGLNQQLARAQSASIAQYVRERFGDQKLRNLVQSHIDRLDCQEGVQRALGISLDELEAAWLSEYEGPSPLQQFLDDYGLWLIILLAGFILALTIIRFSTRGKS